MRKSRRLQVPNDIVELRYAYLPWIEHPQRIVAEFPFSQSDAHPALILVDDPNKGTVMEEAVLIIPFDAPYDPIKDALFGAALGLVRSDYTRVLTRLSGEPFLEELTATGWDEPPFSCDALSELHRRLDRVIESHSPIGKRPSSFVSELRETLTYMCERRPGARLWSPFTVMRGRPSAKHFCNWRILESWESWEKRCLFREDRADEYYGGKSSSAQQERFRVRLDYLRLKAPSKVSKSRKKRREMGMRRHSP